MKRKIIDNRFLKKYEYIFFLLFLCLSFFFQIQCISTQLNYKEKVYSPASFSKTFSVRKRAEALFKIVQSHPDGFTCDSKTFQPVLSGYAVSPFKSVQIVSDRKTLSIDRLVDMIFYIDRLAKIIEKPVYAGGWFNTQADRYYLDASMVVKDLDQALYLAKAGKQYAVYDLSKKKVMETDFGIKRLKEQRIYDPVEEKRAKAFIDQVNQILP